MIFLSFFIGTETVPNRADHLLHVLNVVNQSSNVLHEAPWWRQQTCPAIFVVYNRTDNIPTVKEFAFSVHTQMKRDDEYLLNNPTWFLQYVFSKRSTGTMICFVVDVLHDKLHWRPHWWICVNKHIFIYHLTLSSVCVCFILSTVFSGLCELAHAHACV